eukprot:13451-Heterococcus_DN1.PRE.2
MATNKTGKGFEFTGQTQFSRAHIVFSKKNAPTADEEKNLAEVLNEDKRVGGVGQNTMTYKKEHYVAFVVQANENQRFGKLLLTEALFQCGLKQRVHNYGKLKLTGAAVTLLRSWGEISVRSPGPKKAARAPANKGQPRKRSGAAVADSNIDSDGDNGNDSEGFTGGKSFVQVSITIKPLLITTSAADCLNLWRQQRKGGKFSTNLPAKRKLSSSGGSSGTGSKQQRTAAGNAAAAAASNDSDSGSDRDDLGSSSNSNAKQNRAAGKVTAAADSDSDGEHSNDSEGEGLNSSNSSRTESSAVGTAAAAAGSDSDARDEQLAAANSELLLGALRKVSSKIAAEMGIDDPTDHRVLPPLIELLEEQAATTTASETATAAVAALEDQFKAIAAKLGVADSSSEAVSNAITSLLGSAATAQQQRDGAVVERETTAGAMAKLQADAATAQQEGASATAALQQEVTAATQRAHDLSSAVCELLLDLGETIGSGTTLPDEVQELGLSTDALLSKDTLSKAGTVLKDAANKLAAAAASTPAKRDAPPASTAGVLERAEPVQAQQQQQQQQQQPLLYALTRLSAAVRLETLRMDADLEVRDAVKGAILADTGTSVLVRGPSGCGKSTAVLWELSYNAFDLDLWCKKHGKARAVLCDIWTPYTSADLYGAILQALPWDERHKIDGSAEAKQQLDALLCKTSSSSSSDVPMIVVRVFGIDDLDVHDAQQVLEWAHAPGSRLILVGIARSTLPKTLPEPRQHVVFEPCTDSDVKGWVKMCVGKEVQPAALALCVQHASGNKRRAAALCKHAVQLALSDRNKSNGVTLSHMEQAVRFFVYK